MQKLEGDENVSVDNGVWWLEECGMLISTLFGVGEVGTIGGKNRWS